MSSLSFAAPQRFRPQFIFVVLVALWFAQLAPLVAGIPGAVAGVAAPGISQPVVPGVTPAGLDAAGWAAIQAQIAAGPYRAYPEAGGYSSANPAHGWQIRYNADGTTQLTPRDATAPAWQWGLRLAGYGYAELTAPALPAGQSTAEQRFIYHWDDTIDEWWQNGAIGLEQGFTVHSKPAGGEAGLPLRVTMDLSGDLRAETHPDGLAFRDPTGATAFTYTKLRSWDATGRDLPSTMALDGDRITLTVNDAGAIYPITIDPLVQQAYLKASNTEAGDQFGLAVAISGDTVVVGAPTEDSNATGVNGNQGDNNAASSGAAYVFVRNGTTWSQQAYLKASNTGAGDLFGRAVAISGDTIVVGANGEDSDGTGVNGNRQGNNSSSSSGAAYVFVRNGTTWSQQA
jgi:hypothetical protein